MNKEALEALLEYKNGSYELLNDYGDVEEIIILDDELKNDIRQALTQEVSKDTNIKGMEDAIKYISYALEEAIECEICDGIDTSFAWKIICNYITNVPKEVGIIKYYSYDDQLDYEDVEFECESCNKRFLEENYKYCPHCGVKFKGEVDNG